MALVLLQEVTEREAFLENDEIDGQDQGHIIWLAPEQQESNEWLITIEGTNVQGGTILPTETTYPQQSTSPTPGQVILWIIKKLKPIICPECI